MTPFIVAWLIGEGIITYRQWKQTQGPPGPGQLLFSSLLFVALGIIAESPKARPIAVTFAWGIDLAAFLNLAEFGGGKSTGIQWPPKKAVDYQIIPDGMPSGPDPVGAHTSSSGASPPPPHDTGQGTATGPGRPGIG